MRQRILAFFAPPVIGRQSGRWGFWQTVLLSISAVAMVQFVPSVLMRIMAGPMGLPDAATLQMRYSPFFMCMSVLVAAPVCTGYVMFLIGLKEGRGIKEYTGINHVKIWVILLWLFGLFLFVLLLGAALGPYYKPPETLKALFSYDNKALLVLTVVLAGPIYEEFLFRGFLLEGLKEASEPFVAVVFSSLLFSFTHFQYDFIGIMYVFFIGLALGYAKVKTGSLYTTTAMHMSFNMLIFLQGIKQGLEP